MLCPTCNAEIDADSHYCDQCGAALMKCPQCGQFRKGKFCPTCGKATQPAGGAPAAAPQSAPAPQQQQQQQSQQQQQQQRPQQPQQPQYQQQPQQPQQPQSFARPTTYPGDATATSVHFGPQTQPTRMVCRAMGIVLDLQNGALIGRTNGNYPQLSVCDYLSRTHARIDFDGSRWTITDLGSTNGTMVNGFPCRPSAPFGKGDTVRLGAYYDFVVE